MNWFQLNFKYYYDSHLKSAHFYYVFFICSCLLITSNYLYLHTFNIHAIFTIELTYFISNKNLTISHFENPTCETEYNESKIDGDVIPIVPL